jgi:hypothetical protein
LGFDWRSLTARLARKSATVAKTQPSLRSQTAPGLKPGLEIRLAELNGSLGAQVGAAASGNTFPAAIQRVRLRCLYCGFIWPYT